MRPRLLIAEDDRKYVRILELLLDGEGYELTAASDGTRALAALGEGAFDVVLTDLQMPGADGLAVLRRAREVDPDVPVVVITAYGTIASAVEAMRGGAFDYVEKPFNDAALKLQVARAVEARRLKLQNRALRTSLAEATGFHRILGDAPPLRAAVELARKVAPTDTTVLLLGESGTGKELFARAIHEASGRSAGPFVKVNCAAIPAALLESELFGAERGAFTGADRARPGRLEQAHCGTIFLDEVGELELGLQPKLLRALEERVVERLGAGAARHVDVRIVAATNRDLEAATRAGAFRTDLFHRLAVFPITLPPLRERRADIPLLVRALVARLNEAMGRQVTGVSPAVLERLARQPWPGNVRQLANAIERAMIVCAGSELTLEHLAVGDPVPASGDGRFVLPDEGASLEEVEASLLRQALARAGGNKAQAAKLLGLTRSTLRYRLEKHGLG
jgi:two-component system response regulator AtoC